MRVAVPIPPFTIARPRSFFVLMETRVFPAMMSLRTLVTSDLVRSTTIDPADIDSRCRRIFRPGTLSGYEPGLEVQQVESQSTLTVMAFRSSSHSGWHPAPLARLQA